MKMNKTESKDEANEVTDLNKDDSNSPNPVVEANSLVKNYVITSMGLGMVPVPLFDLAALVATQIKMVHGLSKLYDVPFKRDVVKSVISSLLSGALGIGAVIGMASLTKMFPVIGSIIGGGTVSGLSGSLTYAVGRVFIAHFEQGGTLLNIDPKQMREYFKRELKDGKEVAEDLNAAKQTEATA